MTRMGAVISCQFFVFSQGTKNCDGSPLRLRFTRGSRTSGRKKGMFERCSETARRAIHSSRYMAGRVGSPEIETEHLLLGLLREDKVLARRCLGSPWAANALWRKIEQSKPVREKIPGSREIPLS